MRTGRAAAGGAGVTRFAISRGTSEWLKGVAILLMLAHHLFGLPMLRWSPLVFAALLAASLTVVLLVETARRIWSPKEKAI